MIFAAGLAGTIILTNGELVIARDLAIIGPGAATLTLRGQNKRIFGINSTIASLSGLTLSSGFAINARGGAILNTAALTLDDCVIYSSIAFGSDIGLGGGVYNSGSLTATNCTFLGNNAFKGGAIYNTGTVALNNCTLSLNRTGDPASMNTTDVSGAGIYNDSGTVGITNCTLYQNSAVASGGGIYNSGTMAVISSTFAANFTFVHDGAGVYNAGTLTLRNSTLSGNQAYNYGAGLFHAAGTTTIQNTLIAGNLPYTPLPDPAVGLDVFGDITSEGHNFIGKTNSSTGWGASDLVGSIASPLNPLLGPLQNNGGQTLTMAPSTLSAAIDTGDDAALGPPLNLITDQRGFPRRLGLHLDIGAVEVDPAQGSNITVTTTDDHDDGVAGIVDCTLREAINAANANTIMFASNVTGVITLRLGELGISHDLNILGPGAMILAINGNGSNRVFNISSGTVLIYGLAITNGRVVGLPGANGTVGGSVGGDGGSALGGGIYNQAALTLSNCWITGNIALGGAGGAGGPDDENNLGGSGGPGGAGSGGGIYSTNSLTLCNCTISGNTATGGAGGNGPSGNGFFNGDGGNGGAGGTAAGAGIDNTGILSVKNCTLAGNFANGGAGGLGGVGQQDGNGGVGGEGGNGIGGGIANLNNLGMASCTVSDNVITGGAGGLGGSVGGRGNPGTNGSVGRGFGGGLLSDLAVNSVQNSIIAGNSSPSAPDCSSTFTSQGYNLIGDATGAVGFSGEGDQVGSSGSPLNPQLGPLIYHGGPAPTMALLPGSPAIDKGNSGVLNTDQRGRPRPFDFPSVSNANDGGDIGAFELSLPILRISRSGPLVVVSWPVSESGFTLQSAAQFAAVTTWTVVPGTPAISGSEYTVTNNAVVGELFYRLISP